MVFQWLKGDMSKSTNLMNNSYQFEFKKFMHEDVMRLVTAHETGKSFHRGGDIRAAGEEVETAVRALLKRRLPGAYFVGQGHIVDCQLQQSAQCDVVIADRTDGQVLTTGAGETEYFPYESVYTIGEVKSSYKKADLVKLIKDLKHIHTELWREKVYPPSLATEWQMHCPGDAYLNPLFSFLIVVDSSKFRMADVAKLYATTPIQFLPSVVCLLDRGNIFHTSWGSEPGNFRPNPQAEMLPPLGFNSTESALWPTRDWRLLPHGDETTRYETNFATFYFYLFAYLRACKLQPTPLDYYLKHLFSFNPPDKVADAWTDPPSN